MFSSLIESFDEEVSNIKFGFFVIECLFVDFSLLDFFEWSFVNAMVTSISEKKQSIVKKSDLLVPSIA